MLTRPGRFELNYLSRRRDKPTHVVVADGSLNSWLEGGVTSLDMILEYAPNQGFLNVAAIGEFSLQEAERTFLEMLDAVGLIGILMLFQESIELIEVIPVG